MIKVDGCNRSMEGSLTEILADVTITLYDLIDNIMVEFPEENPVQLLEEMIDIIQLNILYPLNNASEELLEYLEEDFSNILDTTMEVSNDIQERFKTDEV